MSTRESPSNRLRQEKLRKGENSSSLPTGCISLSHPPSPPPPHRPPPALLHSRRNLFILERWGGGGRGGPCGGTLSKEEGSAVLEKCKGIMTKQNDLLARTVIFCLFLTIFCFLSSSIFFQLRSTRVFCLCVDPINVPDTVKTGPHTHAHTQTHTHRHTRAHTHRRTHTHTHTNTHTYTHTHTRTHTHTHTHTHARTHAHTSARAHTHKDNAHTHTHRERF